MATMAPAFALTGAQKAAILLVALGDEVSAGLMRHLSDDEVQRVSEAIASLPAIPLERAELILEEFQDATNGMIQVGFGGPEYARRVLTHAFGPEVSKRHLDRLPTPGDQPSGLQLQLQRAEPQMLARFVAGEHPQTMALILSRLKPGQSAKVLAMLDPKLRPGVAVRIARLEKISPAVIAKISSVVGGKLKAMGEVQRESSGGVRAVAEIFNEMDPAFSDELLGQIGEENSQLADEIRNKMFVFADLLTIDQAGITELMSRADRRQLTIALKGATEELRAHLLKGLSQRGSAMLLEDMEALGPIKIKDVEAAQEQIIALVRQLETEGVVSRKGGDDKNEQYV